MQSKNKWTMLFDFVFPFMEDYSRELLFSSRSAPESCTPKHHHIHVKTFSFRYVYKRLRFLGNKLISHFITLFFVALWHGIAPGFFLCFIGEFVIIVIEQQVSISSLLAILVCHLENQVHHYSKILCYIRHLWCEAVVLEIAMYWLTFIWWMALFRKKIIFT